MWIIIYKEHPKIRPELVGRVFATENVQPPEGAYPADKFEVKEWGGAPPNLGDPDAGVLPDLDPTQDDPDYADKVQQRLDFEDLRADLVNELQYLADIIPTIDTMTLEELRAAFKRSERRDERLLKALRYVFRRLS